MRLGSYAALLATIFLAACTGSMSFFQRALIWETGFSVTSAIAYGDAAPPAAARTPELADATRGG